MGFAERHLAKRTAAPEISSLFGNKLHHNKLDTKTLRKLASNLNKLLIF
jgi:hypothetical protein